MSVHGEAAIAEKGARYLGLLDQALCSASWSDISELARKVDKHAPERNCLTLAARAQSQIAAASHRPNSASSVTSTSIHGLGELIPRLIEAVAGATQSHPDDAFIGSTCLAEIHWLRETPLEALKALDDATASPSDSAGANVTLGWLEVCEVKASFIRASCLDTSGRQNEAREAFQAAIGKTPGYRSPELRRWTERLLARACMYCVKKMPSPSLQDFTETYAAFCAWGEFWQRAPVSPGSASSTARLDIPRRQVWAAYYELLSTLLQQGVLLPISQPGFISALSSIPESQRGATRQHQRAEMKRVEATYETFLLAETNFPKAGQSNTEIEQWCEQIMANWRIFSGSQWTDAELGDGGKRTVSREVLDILYRAATKSFHSTPVLRHLFTVHTALSEFDLAMHAFDSYVDIVDKGKARAERTGKHETGFDDDDTAMLTAVEAIRVLCRYGDREQAEKAMEINKSIQKWLEQRRPTTADGASPVREANGDDQHRPSSQPTASLLKSSTLGAAFRAIGISQSRWAQLTFESETRSSLFNEAKDNLQRAHRLDADNIETTHALALVLAELRDVSGSINLIRSIIEPKPDTRVQNGRLLYSPVERQRRLVPLWHLLALCLSGEDQFEAAAHICEASYRQFGDSQTLFGSSLTFGAPGEASSETSATGGIVDQMESFEKESMVQIKMTQIMLFELMEGPEEATDLTDELSSLYSRLFGNPEQVVAELASKPPPTAASHSPSKLGGTLRSITGSMRPRSTRSTRSSQKEAVERVSDVTRDNHDPTPQPTAMGPPIAITITNEDGVASEKLQNRHHLPHLPFHGRGRRNSSTRSKSRTRSVPRHGDMSNEKYTPAATDAATTNTTNPEKPLEKAVHNTPHNHQSSTEHEDQPPGQDVRSPAPHPTSTTAIPEPQMSSLYERRHKVSVLVRAWLFSAGLYIRAETYDDAENLVDDAAELIESLEFQLKMSEDGTNARRLFYRGWGSGRSIDKLWADLWSIKAQLAVGRERPHEAIAAFEQTLAHDPDHPVGIVGLSNLLMDIYEEKLPAEEPVAILPPLPTASNSLIAEAKPSVTRPTTASTIPSRRPSAVVKPEPMETKDRKIDPSPAELNRLAARDRAYMLLSNLTKQGAGWDDSEAWYTLARAHELSGEIGKAKQALWWVVELENNRPIRPWKDVSPGGYTL